MKVYEMSFRDMDQKMVEIHGMKMVKLLEKMGLKLDNLYGALMYGYIDHNAGFIFEIVALETKKRNIEYRIVPIGVSCKIPRFDVQEIERRQRGDSRSFGQKIAEVAVSDGQHRL